MTEPQANIYIRVPYDLKQKLEVTSRETNESMTAIIVKSIRDYLEKLELEKEKS